MPSALLSPRFLHFLLLCGAAALTARAAELRITVTDETGHAVWTRLEVRGPDFQTYQPATAILDERNFRAKRTGADRYYAGSFVVEGQARLELPPGRYTVVAEHGLEYDRVERAVEVTADGPAAVALQLRPWIRMRNRGWYSGDLHVHRPPKDAPSLALAEDVNLSVVFTMWNKQNLWAGQSLPADPVVQASPNHLVTLLNAEDERGGGAWMLHHLDRPLDHLGVDGRWYPPGIRFVREARARKSSPGDLFPWFDSEKPIWWEAPVMMALATPDSLGVVHNHFNQYSVMANEAWGRPRDQARFPGLAGFTEYALQLYYRYLNLGFRVPPSAGAASGVLAAPVGYNRTYVPVNGPLTVEKWYAALRAGKVLVTNGPILFFETKRSGGKLKASIEAHAREPIDRIEIVANGEILHTLTPKAGGRDVRSTVTLDPGRHSWIAARCFLKTEGTVRFAHTSPIDLPASWDASADAQYFADWMAELIEQAQSEGKRFRDGAEKQEILALYREARNYYLGKAGAARTKPGK